MISDVATSTKPMRKYHEYRMFVLRFVVWPFVSDFSQVAAENDKSKLRNKESCAEKWRLDARQLWGLHRAVV